MQEVEGRIPSRSSHGTNKGFGTSLQQFVGRSGALPKERRTRSCDIVHRIHFMERAAAHFSRHAFMRTACLKVKHNLCVIESVPHPSLSPMSMLNVSLSHFPCLLSSPSAHLSRLSTCTTPIGRSPHNGPSAPARWSESGQWPIQPKTQATSPSLPTSSVAWIRSTPMIFPDSHHDFRKLRRHRIDSHLCRRTISKHTAAASRSMPGRIWKQNADHVSRRPSYQETGVDTESVATTFFSSQSKGNRFRDSNVVHSLRDRDHLQKILEQKDLGVRGELLSQQKKYEAEAEVEARNWEKKNSDSTFREINQEFESQKFQLQQTN